MKLAEEKTRNMNPEELRVYRRLSRQSTSLLYVQLASEMTRLILISLTLAYGVTAIMKATDVTIGERAFYEFVRWGVPCLLGLGVHYLFQWKRFVFKLRKWHHLAIGQEIKHFRLLSGIYNSLYKILLRTPFLFFVPLLAIVSFLFYSAVQLRSPSWAVPWLIVFCQLLMIMLTEALDTTSFDLEDFWKAHDQRLAKPTLFDL